MKTALVLFLQLVNNDCSNDDTTGHNLHNEGTDTKLGTNVVNQDDQDRTQQSTQNGACAASQGCTTQNRCSDGIGFVSFTCGGNGRIDTCTQ